MYTALYRKWRPMTFDDVVSQPHVTQTLARQVAEGKTAHAYLFTGSRGTGKTTCARILAKAINCLNPHDGKPCLECEICRAADAGTLSDIVEIDAATNTGVDDVRELREAAVYTPELCRYKVYIIDEVHMISEQAFNALLKIMEEPPEHVKFILATTEIHKIPATIISRCQRFDFRRIREEDIVDRLMYIASQEKTDLTHEGAELIARLSDGAMRDALSLMDQCMAFSEHIDPEAVSDAAGIAGREYLFEILEAAAKNDAPAAISVVDRLYAASKDMTRLCDELITQIRNLMLIKTVPERPELVLCLSWETERLKSIADSLSLGEILSKLKILQDCAEALPRAVSKRTEFEMSVVKLCSQRREDVSGAAGDIQTLERRISRLEAEISALKAGGAAAQKAEPVREKSPTAEKPAEEALTAEKAPEGEKPQTAPQEESAAQKAAPERCARWEEIVERLTADNPGFAGSLRDSEALVAGNALYITVTNSFAKALLKNAENAASLKRAAHEILGVEFRTIRLKAPSDGAQDEAKDNRPDLGELIEKARRAGVQVVEE